MTSSTNLKPEQVRALLAALPGKAKCELMLDWPCEGQVSLCSWDIDAEQIMREGLHHFDSFDYKILHDEGETDAPIWQLLAQAIPAMQQLVALHAAALALVEVDAEHRAWLEAHPLGSRDEEHDLFGPRFHSAYSALAALVQPSAASAGAAALGGAGGTCRNDTPERSYRQELASADGQVYASIEVEADTEGHPVPVGLTVHRGVLLEAYGEDEADVVLALSRAEARALAGGLEAAAGVE